MKEIRLCDDTNPERMLNLCVTNNLDIGIQGFYKSDLIETKEIQNLIESHGKIYRCNQRIYKKLRFD